MTGEFGEQPHGLRLAVGGKPRPHLVGEHHAIQRKNKTDHSGTSSQNRQLVAGRWAAVAAAPGGSNGVVTPVGSVTGTRDAARMRARITTS
jgi:hypothetical protein